MNKYLALVCCLASLASARPDGYNYNLGSNSDSSALSAPVNSYVPAASGEDVNVGFDTGASSLGSINFLSPGYNVGAIQAGSSGFSSSGSSSSSGGLLSGGGLSNAGGLTGFGGGGLVSSGGLAGSGGLGYSSNRYGSGNLGLTTVNLGSLGGGASLGGGFGLNQGYSGAAGSYGGGQIVQQQYAPQFQAPLITKSFYVHSAPEDHDEQQIVRYVTIGRPLKNYRVVFINAPSSTSTKAKIIAQVAPVEDKTAIYVLSKKSNDLDISADVVSKAPVAPSKPDVFFIKYKTPAEALRAQRVIQSQYDQLGGSSSFSNEGTIPVQSVIGSAGESDASSYSNAQGSSQSSDVSGITNIAASPVLPSGGQTNINIGTVGKPLLVPAGQSSGSSSFGGNYVTTPLVLTSGDSSSGASSFGGLSGGQSSFGGLSSGQSFGGGQFGGLSGGQSSFGGLSGGQSSFGGLSGGQSSFGGLSGGQSSFGGLSGGQSSFGGLSPDQSQFDQVSSGNFQTYLPPSKYRKY